MLDAGCWMLDLFPLGLNLKFFTWGEKFFLLYF